MKAVLKTIGNTLKVFVLFVSCTLLFYYGMVWVDHEYEGYHKYDKPEGDVLKVDQANDEGNSFHWFKRLKTFYEIGE